MSQLVKKGTYTTARIMIDQVEESALNQIQAFVDHQAFSNPIAIMPDVHAGRGSVIGFTMKMTEKVIPAIVGVDIGCGLRSVNIGSSLPLSLEVLDHRIRQRIPFGMETHDKSIMDIEKEFPWHRANVLAEHFAQAYGKEFEVRFNAVRYDMDWFELKCRSIGMDLGRAIKSIATLGSGNHFIEVGQSDKSEYWVTVHSGSRNFGLRICNFWQTLAINKVKRMSKEEHRAALARLKAEYKGEELYHKIKALKNEEVKHPSYDCPDDLRWLEGEDAQGYLSDMIFAQTYAEVNREYMLRIILDILNVKDPVEEVETVHNFIDFRDFIIRKGAIRAYAGERFLLPFNMRDGVLLCTGKSNPDWNCSAPHGAGRIMSRAQAKKRVDLDLFKKQMEGIYSTSVGVGTLDEAPDAYKDSKVIEGCVEPTADILGRIRPIHNMKDVVGAGEDL